MTASSFSESKKLYDYSVNLASSWITKYYPKNKVEIFGVPIEKVQAFSQHHFFSSVIEGSPVNDIWSQYPQTTNSKKDHAFILSKFFSTALYLARFMTLPKKSLKIHSQCDLIILASGRHLQDLASLVESLNKKYKIFVIGKVSDNFKKNLRSKKVKFTDIENGWQFISRRRRLYFLSLFLFRRWFKEGNEKIFEDKRWKWRLLYLRLIQFPEIASLLDFAKHLLTVSGPRLLITTTSNDTFGASFTLMAQQIGIRVAEIQHGIATWKIIESDFYLSNYYLVWGRAAEKIHPANAYIVGCPFLKLDHANTKLYRNQSVKKLLVLWTPTFGTSSLFRRTSNKEFFGTVIKSLTRLGKEFKVTIRSHPSYPIIEDLRGLSLPRNISVGGDGDIETVIKNNDIILTGPTTAGLIAIIQRKPLFYLDNSYLSHRFGDPFVTSGSAVNISLKDISNLDQIILLFIKNRKLLKQQVINQQRFLKNYVSCFGTDSTKDIFKFIEKIIEK